MTPGEYTVKVDGIMSALLAVVLRLLRPALKPGASERTKRAAAAELTFAVRAARAKMGELTGEFITEQAKSQAGIKDPFIPAVRGYSPDAARAVIDDAIEKQKAHKWSPQKTVDLIAPTFLRHAEQAGRDMVVDAAEVYSDDEADELNRDMRVDFDELDADDDDVPDDDYGLSDDDEAPTEHTTTIERDGEVIQIRATAYARVLTGADNCAFCVMLASRGAIYKSESSAAARNRQTGAPTHNWCDCKVVPVYNAAKWPGTAFADDLFENLWQPATKGYKQLDAINALRRRLYAMKKAGETIAPDIRQAA